MAPNKGQTGSLYNRAPTNMNSYKQGGEKFDKDRLGDRDRFSDKDRFSDRDRDRHLYNRADRDHDYDRDRDHDHRGIVSGNFFEHGRHFRFAASYTASGCS